METVSFPIFRRWVVLTSNYLFTFKDQRVYDKPTEVIPLKSITVMKSQDEHQRPNVFV
jgi:hypothetical protein